MSKPARKKHQSPFAKNLKAILLERGLSQKTAAQMATTTTSTVNDWMAGSQPSDLISVQKLARALNEIKNVQKSITDLEDRNRQISDKLLSNDLTDELMTWLSEQITAIKKDLSFKSIELERLNTKRAELKDESGLQDIQKQIKKSLQGFDGLTRFQQRSLLTKIISKVVIRSDNQLEVCF